MTSTSESRRVDVGGLLLFRVRGVPVLLAPSWWLGSVIVVLFYAPLVRRILPGATDVAAATLAVTFALLLAASVLAHELGHCVVALRLGIPVRRVRLFLLGGISEVGRSPREPRHEGWVAAAGPAVSAVLSGLFFLGLLVVPYGGPSWLLVLECAVANLAVTVFNVLPGLPLDGGRMVRAGIWAATGQRAMGTKVAVAGGVVVTVALLCWALAGLVAGDGDRWLRLGVCVVTAWFVLTGAGEELANEQRQGWPEDLRLAEIVRPVLQLPAESPVGDALAASAGRGVVLVRADGVAAGLLDEGAAQRLAASSPRSPAERAAESIRPENVLLLTDPGEEIVERVRATAAWQFLVVDDNGRPSAVLRREDLRAALDVRRYE